jgi:siderophore synthetase component
VISFESSSFNYDGHITVYNTAKKDDELTPDSSEIWLLSKKRKYRALILPARYTSKTGRHRIVEEFWYLLSEKGLVYHG